MAFNPSEKYQSQIPALQLLVALGFAPLSQTEALERRGGRKRAVVLDDILADQLLKINRFTHRGREYPFDLEDAHEAMRRLKPPPDRPKGLRQANQDIYDSLVLGTTITKNIDGDSKSYSFRYIDWENPDSNVFHVTYEMEVERTSSTRMRRLDIVAFVNGIPFIAIENKRPTKNLKKGSDQLIRYQSEDNIPQLFHCAQLLMSMNREDARYATVGTEQKFWQPWRDDEDRDEDIAPLANRALTSSEQDAIFSGDLAEARSFFADMAAAGSRAVTKQDRAIYALCRPQRLLDLVRRFTVFDGGVRKIARHQQFFAVQEAMRKVGHVDLSGCRKGGVIWHTQGSGKSLTMVMLGRALALEKSISNPRIVIVTDRDDLDRQIRDTFKSCEMEPARATSGKNLARLIREGKPLITTIVNKFATALQGGKVVDEGTDIFVLVDESHRTQSGRYGGYGQLAVQMHRILPNACYLGFTGTPLLRREKNTLDTFGGLIHRYPINEAIEDEAIVPLLYEGRIARMQVAQHPVDQWFDKVCEKLPEQQKADLRRRFARPEYLSRARQSIFAKAVDISEHFRETWKDTGLKAQLVAPSKAAAIQFKEILDKIGAVSSEVVISPPDDQEGNEDVGKDSKDPVRVFWKDMMDRYGTESEYNRQIIEAFKGSGDPDILIVVSKLLTGFDAPRNTVLYICKTLREHSLLQAIARVNRLYGDQMEEKRFGFIIDYEGLLGELDKALTDYGPLEEYDASDLDRVVHDIREEGRRLPQLNRRLWDHFSPVENQKDMEALEQYMADDAIRREFYQHLGMFGRCLHIVLSSEKAVQVIAEEDLNRIKEDWRRFSELRRSVRIRYQEAADMREFDTKIQGILDDHVSAEPAETIIEPVNINEEGAVSKVLKEAGISDASKADRIASATRRCITERMDENPEFYRKFSELLEEAINDYHARRISEKDYLNKVGKFARQVGRGADRADVPDAIKGDADAQAFFDLLSGIHLHSGGGPIERSELAGIAQEVVELVGSRIIVGIWSNESAQNEIRNAIDDYLCDTLRDARRIDLSGEMIEKIEAEIMRLARARFRA